MCVTTCVQCCSSRRWEVNRKISRVVWMTFQFSRRMFGTLRECLICCSYDSQTERNTHLSHARRAVRKRLCAREKAFCFIYLKLSVTIQTYEIILSLPTTPPSPSSHIVTGQFQRGKEHNPIRADRKRLIMDHALPTCILVFYHAVPTPTLASLLSKRGIELPLVQLKHDSLVATVTRMHQREQFARARERRIWTQRRGFGENQLSFASHPIRRRSGRRLTYVLADRPFDSATISFSPSSRGVSTSSMARETGG